MEQYLEKTEGRPAGCPDFLCPLIPKHLLPPLGGDGVKRDVMLSSCQVPAGKTPAGHQVLQVATNFPSQPPYSQASVGRQRSRLAVKADQFALEAGQYAVEAGQLLPRLSDPGRQRL